MNRSKKTYLLKELRHKIGALLLATRAEKQIYPRVVVKLLRDQRFAPPQKVNKKALAQAIFRVLEATGKDIEWLLQAPSRHKRLIFNFPMHRIVLLWEKLWVETIISGQNPLSSLLGSPLGTFIQRDLETRIPDLCLEQSFLEKYIPTDNAPRSSVANLSEWLFSWAYSDTLLQIARVRPVFFHSKAADAIRALVVASARQKGTLVIVGEQGASPRVEFRIPILRPAEYPEIINDEVLSWLQVSVMRSGIFVPEKVWRFPNKLTVNDLLQEPNAELRRLMLESMGTEKFAQEAKLRLINQEGDYKLFAIADTRLPEELTRGNLLYCVCPSTKREYYLRVPPTIRKAKEAVAWTFGEREQEYQPLIET